VLRSVRHGTVLRPRRRLPGDPRLRPGQPHYHDPDDDDHDILLHDVHHHDHHDVLHDYHILEHDDLHHHDDPDNHHLLHGHATLDNDILPHDDVLHHHDVLAADLHHLFLDDHDLLDDGDHPPAPRPLRRCVRQRRPRRRVRRGLRRRRPGRCH